MCTFAVGFSAASYAVCYAFSVSWFVQQLTDVVREYSVEAAGFATSIAGVWLAARQNWLTWPVSLLGVLLSVVVFYRTQLYADVLLQFFYIGVTAYGWAQWLHGGINKTKLPVSTGSAKLWAGTLLAGIVVSPVTGFLFARYTHAAAPYLDAALAVFSVLTTWLMGRKILEHWLLWVIIDLLYTGLYFYKGLYIYAVLFFIFTLLALDGYRRWRLALLQQQPVYGS